MVPLLKEAIDYSAVLGLLFHIDCSGAGSGHSTYSLSRSGLIGADYGYVPSDESHSFAHQSVRGDFSQMGWGE